MREAGKHQSASAWFAKFVFSNFRLMFAIFFIVSSGTLIAAIACCSEKTGRDACSLGSWHWVLSWNVAAIGVSVFYVW